jgi:hypothetical protein
VTILIAKRVWSIRSQYCNPPLIPSNSFVQKICLQFYVIRSYRQFSGSALCRSLQCIKLRIDAQGYTQKKFPFMKLQVLMKMITFWDIALCTLVEVDRRFRVAMIHSTISVKAAIFKFPFLCKRWRM